MRKLTRMVRYSQAAVGTPEPSQRRTIVYSSQGTHTQEYCREHEREGQVVEYFPIRRFVGGRHLSGVVVEEVL